MSFDLVLRIKQLLHIKSDWGIFEIINIIVFVGTCIVGRALVNTNQKPISNE